jgi:hypothetical protein
MVACSAGNLGAAAALLNVRGGGLHGFFARAASS